MLKQFYLIVVLHFICFTNPFTHANSNIFSHLGTRTPYRFVFNKDVTRLNYSGCHPRKIWMLVRHGTRLPSKSDIHATYKHLRNIQHDILSQNQNENQVLTGDQLDYFSKWNTNLNSEQEKILTKEGEEELMLLAQRMQKRFPGVITNQYDNSTHKFRYTATQRAKQSAKYFAIGLFNDTNDQVWFPAAGTRDPALRFYKMCDRWKQQVKYNNKTYEQQRLFGATEEMADTLRQVSHQLGLNYTLTLEQTFLMYKMCGYETAWYKNTQSPWCAAFNDHNIKNMEYYDDLKHYYLDGYGYFITYKQACMSVKDMIEHFREKDGPLASFLFSHSGTLLKTLSHLKLYKPDAPLTHENYNERRPWRMSNIDTFATNLAFILYNCSEEPHILTLHQERVVRLPMCPTELCPMSVILSEFQDTIEQCDLSQMCQINEENRSGHSEL